MLMSMARMQWPWVVQWQDILASRNNPAMHGTNIKIQKWYSEITFISVNGVPFNG
jgi:hypothetical protein